MKQAQINECQHLLNHQNYVPMPWLLKNKETFQSLKFGACQYQHCNARDHEAEIPMHQQQSSNVVEMAQTRLRMENREIKSSRMAANHANTFWDRSQRRRGKGRGKSAQSAVITKMNLERLCLMSRQCMQNSRLTNIHTYMYSRTYTDIYVHICQWMAAFYAKIKEVVGFPLHHETRFTIGKTEGW